MTSNPLIKPIDRFMLTKTVLNPKWHVIEAKVLRKPGKAALRACLRTPNDDKPLKRIYYTNVHKWTTEFTNFKTGEVLTSTDAGRSYGRLLNGVNQFHNETKALFKDKKISILFVTLTDAAANSNIRGFIDAYNKRLVRNGVFVFGSVWVAEISKKGHFHYHIAIATSRIRCNSHPSWLRPDALHDGITNVSFVKKSIGAYMKKYMTKDGVNRFRLVRGTRNYGKSRNSIIQKYLNNEYKHIETKELCRWNEAFFSNFYSRYGGKCKRGKKIVYLYEAPGQTYCRPGRYTYGVN